MLLIVENLSYDENRWSDVKKIMFQYNSNGSET